MFWKKSYTFRQPAEPSKSSIFRVTPVAADETSNLKPLRSNPKLGFFFALANAVFFIVRGVFIRKMSHIAPSQLAFVCNAGIFVCSLPSTVYCFQDLVRRHKCDLILLILRGLLGSSSLYLVSTAYELIPLADATIIMAAAPAVTTFVARIYLKESCDLMHSFSLLMTIGGIMLSVRLPDMLNQKSPSRFDRDYMYGLAASFGYVATLSTVFIVLRKLKHIHFSVIMVYFGFIGMIENLAISGGTFFYVNLNCGLELFYCMLLGILSFGCNSALTLAVQVEEAGIVCVVRSSLEIMLSIIFQVIFFQEIVDIFTIAGGTCVISSLSILGIRHWLLLQPADSKARRRLKCCVS